MCAGGEGGGPPERGRKWGRGRWDRGRKKIEGDSDWNRD